MLWLEDNSCAHARRWHSLGWSGLAHVLAVCIAVQLHFAPAPSLTREYRMTYLAPAATPKSVSRSVKAHAMKITRRMTEIPDVSAYSEAPRLLPRFLEPPSLPVSSATIEALPFPMPVVAPPKSIEVHTGVLESSVIAHAEVQARIQAVDFAPPSNLTSKPARSQTSTHPAFVETQSPAGSNIGRAVRGAQFDSVAAGPLGAGAHGSAPLRKPLEILAKPRPVYTEEARRLHVEGEVVLQVLFSASARVSVLRIIHGLGHGLDANAERAAVAIEFSPAFENGSPVDSVATVKIEFQLAD